MADTNDIFTKNQIKKFFSLVDALKKEGITFKFIHAANSAGLVGYPRQGFTMARPGLMLYGLYPHQSLRKKISLKPVMSVYARICFLKEIEKGQSVSYGRRFIAKKPMRLATVSIGYSNGYPRVLSNKSYVSIKGKRCSVVGTVTMDQIMVDVSKVKGVRLGDTVAVMNSQVTADELAQLAGTISYEITCNFGRKSIGA